MIGLAAQTLLVSVSGVSTGAEPEALSVKQKTSDENGTALGY